MTQASTYSVSKIVSSELRLSFSFCIIKFESTTVINILIRKIEVLINDAMKKIKVALFVELLLHVL
jgi:hypothetical protein